MSILVIVHAELWLHLNQLSPPLEPGILIQLAVYFTRCIVDLHELLRRGEPDVTWDIRVGEGSDDEIVVVVA